MDDLKKIPTYITIKPIKIKLNAKVRILLILFEYFNAIASPSYCLTIPYIEEERGTFYE